MSSISRVFSRFPELTREYGLKEVMSRARKRAGADVTLRAREAWQFLTGRRLPSEQEIMSRTLHRWSSLDDLVVHLCRKESPAFLFTVEDKEQWTALWQEAFPSSVQETLAQARDICSLQFEVLGSKYDFACHGRERAEIDWHLDPVSGQRWPMDFVERIDRWMWTDRRLGDYKPIWELNRHQYLTVLGKAYWLTGEEKYAGACTAHLEGWNQNNPYLFGINWYSPLEVGIRLIAWGLAFHYFRCSRRFADVAGKVFLRSLYQQARFLRGHLMLDWPGRNNHIVGEAAALAYVGMLFDEFVEAGEWRDTGLRVLEDEVARQTHADGVNREQAPYYHRFVLDFVLLLLVLARRGAVRPLPSLEAHAEKMLEYIMFALTPGGDLPALGDADDGRGFLLSTCGVRDSFRESLAIGAVLFHRPDFKFVARDFGEGAFWLLGQAGLATFEKMEAVEPGRTSVSFPEAGHYIIRSNWTQRSDYALMRCGEFGLAGEGFCAHAHCDLLSPNLWIEGRPLLVDAGTYTYHGPWRDRFRLTAAHNTVTVDGEEQALPSGPFSWQCVPTAYCDAWEGHRVAGSMTMRGGVTLRRELVHLRPGVWQLTDLLAGIGIHQLEWTFHLAPGLAPIPLPGDGSIQILSDAEPAWGVAFWMPDVTFVVEDGWVSYRYGERTPNQVIRARWQGHLSEKGTGFRWQFSLAEHRTGGEEPL